MSEVLKGFDSLNRSPNRLLIRVGPPVDALQYDVIATEAEPPFLDHLFAFTVRYDADEETLHVVDVDYLFEDRPE